LRRSRHGVRSCSEAAAEKLAPSGRKALVQEAMPRPRARVSRNSLSTSDGGLQSCGATSRAAGRRVGVTQAATTCSARASVTAGLDRGEKFFAIATIIVGCWRTYRNTLRLAGDEGFDQAGIILDQVVVDKRCVAETSTPQSGTRTRGSSCAADFHRRNLPLGEAVIAETGPRSARRWVPAGSSA